MKESLKFAILGLAVVFFTCFPALCMPATITGPEVVQIGQLASFESDLEGDWIVVPAKGVGVAKDTGKKALYLSATLDGDYTIIFFGVEDGTPVITQRALTVGTIQPEPQPQPEPAPKPVSDLTPVQREAVASVMSSIIKGIDAQTIRSPQGARSTFKSLLARKLGTCNGDTCALPQNVMDTIRQWESEMDITTLTGIKAGFTNVLEELQ